MEAYVYLYLRHGETPPPPEVAVLLDRLLERDRLPRPRRTGEILLPLGYVATPTGALRDVGGRVAENYVVVGPAG